MIQPGIFNNSLDGRDLNQCSSFDSLTYIQVALVGWNALSGYIQQLGKMQQIRQAPEVIPQLGAAFSTFTSTLKELSAKLFSIERLEDLYERYESRVPAQLA